MTPRPPHHSRQTPSAVLKATVTFRRRDHVYPLDPDLPAPPRPEPCDLPAPYLVTQPQPVWDHEGD